MKYLSLILILMVSCKEHPNYNPFDDQFNVSVRSLIRDNCDTISAGCGYFNLTTKEGKLRPYYQIYTEDFYTVVGKGFTYRLDTFRVPGFERIYSDNSLLDSIVNIPINETELNGALGRFGYKIISRNQNTIQIVDTVKKDTVVLGIEAYPLGENRLITREISYFRSLI